LEETLGENAIKLPLLGWELPRPKKWDLSALLVLVVSIALAGINLRAALGQAPGESIASWLTTTMVFGQLILASISLFVLGKTAKEGTLWGNLIAVAAMLAGVSGVLLATSLWAIA
jgi:hypothetical protein